LAEAELPSNEQSFVAIATGAPIAAAICGTKVIPTALLRIADRLGVDDADGIFKATLAAIGRLGDTDYRQQDLRPAVTRLVVKIANEMASDFDDNKDRACADYLKFLREVGAVE
jgi:hypothetical protein